MSTITEPRCPRCGKPSEHRCSTHGPGECPLECSCQASITVAGRQYTVTQDGDQYVLTGARGARYRTLRNRPRPHMLYLVNDKNWTMHAPDVWLTDKNGTLEVA